jgi:DNA-binding CsgD family transcriptional regulator
MVEAMREPRLSKREDAIVGMLRADLTRHEIAERLGIAENTVRQYVYLAKLRTGTKTLGGLINWHAEHSAK